MLGGIFLFILTNFIMETVIITEEEFPFIYDSKDIRIVCQQFLDASISRGQFESYIIQKNVDLKD